MLIETIPPYANIHWMDDLKAVRVEWLNQYMTLDQFKNICNKVIDVVKSKNSTMWVADAHNSQGVFPYEIQEFMSNGLVDLAKSAGVSKIVSIMPKSQGFASVGTKSWNHEVKQQGKFKLESFPDLESCRETLLN